MSPAFSSGRDEGRSKAAPHHGSSACAAPVRAESRPGADPSARRALSRQQQRFRLAGAAARGQQGLLHRGPSRRTHQILASLLLGLGIVAAQQAGRLLWVRPVAVEAGGSTHRPASGKATPASFISWVTKVFTRPSPAATRLVVGMPKLTGRPIGGGAPPAEQRTTNRPIRRTRARVASFATYSGGRAVLVSGV